MTDDSIPLCIILIVVSIALTFIVTLVFTALDTVSRSRVKNLVKEDPDGEYKGMAKLIERPSEYRFTDSIIRALLLSAGLYISFTFPAGKAYGRALAVIIFIVAISVFGYIIPAKLGKQHQDAVGTRLSGLQKAICLIFKPVFVIVNFLADIILKLFGQKTDVDDQEFSEDDVMSLLEKGEKSGDLKGASKKLIGSIFRFDDEYADEIMTPRTDVFMIDIDDPQEEYLDDLMSLKYSRIPVFQGEYDNIIGILNVKDYLIKARESGFGKVDIRSILRDPYFVPETKNIDSLFKEMQRDKQHIAILIDEYGGFSGIATMEDIIEEIVGDIDDEYDDEDDIIEKIGDNTYLIDGSVTLDDLNEKIGTDIDSENSETIGGYVINKIGEIPEDGYVNMKVEEGNYLFTILSVSGRRIVRLKMEIRKDTGEDDG